MGTGNTYHVVVIDDVRAPPLSESDDVVTLLFRTPEDGVAILKEFHSSRVRIDELWLDHDMGPDSTIKPVVDWLEEQAFHEDPLDVRHVFVHTSNPYAAQMMMAALTPHYHVTRAEFPLADRKDEGR